MIIPEQVNKEQLEAIKTIQGPVMVIAGPGSGKTRVLTYRIAYLISIGVPAYQILALTFTNKAANEMKERIINLVGEKSKSLWMGTFHSIFARLLRRESEILGFNKNFSIYDKQDSLGLIKSVMNDLHLSTQLHSPQSIVYRIGMLKNQFILPDELGTKDIDGVDEKVVRVYTEYMRRLKQNNSLDFDDLLIKPIELFYRHSKILSSYQDRFRFILIDEYQDTNRAQYLLMKLLASKYSNICVVGDDAQSIYAFRGADIRNILDFQRDYPEAKVVRLEQNYRSTKTILSAADQVIKRNDDQIPKNLWTNNDHGEVITLLECDSDRDEAQSIVDNIFLIKNSLNLRFQDFAAMYRTNAQSRSLEDALRKNSIPYTIIGGIEFYQRKEIKDVLAYFKLLVNPDDDVSFLRIVNYPVRGLGEVAIRNMRKFAAEQSLHLIEAAHQIKQLEGISEKARNSLYRFAIFIRKYQQLQDEMKLEEFSRAFVDEIGILQHFKDEGTPDALSRRENVQELLSAISEYASIHTDARLPDFLQEVSLVADIDSWDERADAVTLLTLHSAKGLEFPVVFITGLEDGLFPYYNMNINTDEIEEERRLFYVGITRAMKKLFLSYAHMRYRFSERTFQTPSRFIDDIDSSLIKIVKRHSGFKKYEQGFSPRPHPKREKKKGIDTESSYDFDQVLTDEDDFDLAKELHAGRLVQHETFGKGKIVHIIGTGESMKAVVNFNSFGMKHLLLKYARLKML
ncbi:MAG: UvrD-helicase domain-containing protein [Bacteroidota bacterium]|nr:UvrD-helicase domain-containing protein [Bacteroidota bacterium]